MLKNLMKTFAACIVLTAIASPASALIDPELDKEFLEAATQVVQAADIAEQKRLAEDNRGLKSWISNLLKREPEQAQP